VDAAARSPEVWKQVAAAVEEREAMYPGNELRVLEIGAGLLPLLSAVAGLQGNFETVHYAAFESNAALLPTCEKVLVGFGLELAERYEHKATSGLAVQVQRWVRPQREGTCGGMTVSLCLGDITSPEALEAVPAVYRRSADVVGGPNLIVGSCVVDLVRRARSLCLQLLLSFARKRSLTLPCPTFPPRSLSQRSWPQH